MKCVRHCAAGSVSQAAETEGVENGKEGGIKGRIVKKCEPSVQNQEEPHEVCPNVHGLVVDLKDAGEIIPEALSREAVPCQNPWFPIQDDHLV